MTKVIFREIKEDGSIIAIFPDIKESEKTFLSYQHIGQHSVTCKEFYLKDTIPTKNYNDLFSELASVGYDDLKVVSKFSSGLMEDIYYVYQNKYFEFVKVIYRNNVLFTQVLDGKKNNFFSVPTIKKAKEILFDLGFIKTEKKFISYGIGWDVA